MHAFTVNYLKRDRREGRRRPWTFVDVGFFLFGVPRLMLWCRLFGHRPVVDGTSPLSSAGDPHRWVCCDRCGVRGDPQGTLDHRVYRVGQRYRGAWAPPGAAVQKPPPDRRGWWRSPGPIEAHPTGELGGELVLGRNHRGSLGFEAKVGNAGSEHTLAVKISFVVGVLYLHTERFGTWLQRRLNPVGYQSKLIGFEVGWGFARWRLWSGRDALRAGPDAEPWWRQGEIRVRTRDWLLGPSRYRYIPAGEPQPRIVRMPEGDYLVDLKLQRVVHGRRRGPKHRSWLVEWETPRGARGIPTEGPRRGHVTGASITMPAESVRDDTWAAEAAARIALWATQQRNQHGWDPTRAPTPAAGQETPPEGVPARPGAR